MARRQNLPACRRSGEARSPKEARQRKSLSRKQKIGVGAAACVVLLLAVGYGTGNQYLSRDNQLNRATTAFIKGDTQAAVQYLTTDDAKLR